MEIQCIICHKTEKELGIKLFYCGRCEEKLYCSKQCQKNHWEIHKQVCKTKIIYKKEHIPISNTFLKLFTQIIIFNSKLFF